MPFTDRQIAALKPKADRYEKKEPGRTGLGIRVSPRGEMAWTFVYRFEGRQRRMVLGYYRKAGLAREEIMGVARAHVALAEAKDKLRTGTDPGAVAAAARREEREAETVAEMVSEYIERHAKPNMKTWGEDQRALTRDVIPAIGNRKVRDVRRRELILLLDRIADRGSPVMRNRTASLLSRFFMFAVDRGVIDASPAVGIKRLPEAPRERVLSMEELHDVWHGLDRMEGVPSLPLAIKMAIVTGQRRGEVIGAPWSEFEGDIWNLPADRTKTGRPNIIPLPPFAMSLLAEIESHRVRPRPKRVDAGRPYDDTPSPFLFPARINGRSLHPNAISRAIIAHRETFGIEHWTAHDLRRSFATHIAEIGVSPDTVSALLNHAPVGITGKVYNHARMIEARRAAMERWCEYLQHIVAGNLDAARAMQGAQVLPMERLTA